MRKRHRKKAYRKLAYSRRLTWRERDYLCSCSGIVGVYARAVLGMCRVMRKAAEWMKRIVDAGQWEAGQDLRAKEAGV